ncbi:MAG: hypothetical protein GKS00_09025 [Alphaproteobacteria bacterium]|nr:hypothetical protein [Alphaproteobacteria bacterium]
MDGLEQRRYKRVVTPRMAMVTSPERSYAAYIEDISVSGVRLHFANDYRRDNTPVVIGETVDVLIDEMSPLKGLIVRSVEPVLVIDFTELDEAGRKRLAAEIMDKQAKFGGVSDS